MIANPKMRSRTHQSTQITESDCTVITPATVRLLGGKGSLIVLDSGISERSNSYFMYDVLRAAATIC